MKFQNPTKVQMFVDGFDNFWACLWCRTNHEFDFSKDFWEWISMGWYDEYIYPYDDPWGPVSPERKLRLGE